MEIDVVYPYIADVDRLENFAETPTTSQTVYMMLCPWWGYPEKFFPIENGMNFPVVKHSVSPWLHDWF